MKILCIGQLVADVLATPVDVLDYGVDTVLVDNIELNNGGDAMNVAVNLARLGGDVAFAGLVGGDEFGVFLRRRLREAGVNACGLGVIGDANTDTALAMINSKGERVFFYRKGANMRLSPCHIREEQLRESGIVHIGGTFLLPGLDGEGAAEVFRRARSYGAITTMDVTHDTSGRWMALIRPSLEGLDYFLPSIAEAAKITGKTDPEGMAEVLLSAGVKTAVIKLGERGCYVRSADESFYQSAFPARVIDTTGAGDAFVSGFLFGLSQSLPLRECAKLACAAGALTVGELGATSKSLNAETIHTIMNEGE